MSKNYWALGVAVALACGSVVSAQTTAPLAEDVRPLRLSGMGLNVSDIEAAKDFYTEVLGLKVALRLPGVNGTTAEYLLSMDGTLTGGMLLVLTNHAREEGSTSYGRVILVVPDGHAMAERVVAHGGTAEKIVEGTNFVRDPEGNLIELYQRPAARPAQ